MSIPVLQSSAEDGPGWGDGWTALSSCGCAAEDDPNSAAEDVPGGAAEDDPDCAADDSGWVVESPTWSQSSKTKLKHCYWLAGKTVCYLKQWRKPSIMVLLTPDDYVLHYSIPEL